jgi:DnaJ-class molecular chaperone
MSEGEVSGTWDTCPTCGGCGMIQDFYVEDCPDCGGSGAVFGGDE